MVVTERSRIIGRLLAVTALAVEDVMYVGGRG
jgi:hypothetical protein